MEESDHIDKLKFKIAGVKANLAMQSNALIDLNHKVEQLLQLLQGQSKTTPDVPATRARPVLVGALDPKASPPVDFDGTRTKG